MMRLFICPECGWMRTVSRRASVECFKCNGVMMQPVKLEYTQYVKMSEQERMDYADSWMYIHRKKSKADTRSVACGSVNVSVGLWTGRGQQQKADGQQ